MNFTNPDQLYEINRQKIQRDRAFILKEEMLKPRSELGVMLNALGNWMVRKGDQLKRRNSASGQNNALALLQGESRIFRA
jgi:hypothetical protein